MQMIVENRKIRNMKDKPEPASPCFLAEVPDTAIADPQQAGIYSEMGRFRSLFAGMENWPWIDQALEAASAKLLEEQGEKAWAEKTGGVRRRGRPFCRLTSPLAHDVVEQLADHSGGLFWLDDQGIGWAVRLTGSTGQGVRFGFAINWGVEMAEVRDHYPSIAEEQWPTLTAADRRKGEKRLGQLACRLRLYRRAEQLLWLIHAQVLRDKTALVRLADVVLGQALWGARQETWPRGWRREIRSTLWSLTQLRMEVLRIPEAGWQPRLGATSVALAHVEDLALTRPDQDFCLPECPMYGSRDRHHHFLVQVGYGFLGSLESLAQGDGTERQYDFRGPGKQRRRRIQENRKEGEIVPVNLPAKIFGGAKWAGLSPGAQRIIQALAREVTRHPDSRRSDRAFLFHGNKVPGTRARSEIVCPLLDPDGKYVAFGGNGKRWAGGYRIIGAQGRGWLYKCGYTVCKDEALIASEIRRFLKDLAEVRKILGLIVAAYDRHGRKWLRLRDLVAIAQGRNGWWELDTLLLRIFGPENYQERLRRYLAKQGGFGEIPGGDPRGGAKVESRQAPTDIRIRMARAGVTQAKLAEALDVSQPFVSQVLTGERAWPPGKQREAEDFLTRIDAQ